MSTQQTIQWELEFYKKKNNQIKKSYQSSKIRELEEQKNNKLLINKYEDLLNQNRYLNEYIEVILKRSYGLFYLSSFLIILIFLITFPF
jgi:hypothetical protein